MQKKDKEPPFVGPINDSENLTEMISEAKAINGAELETDQHRTLIEIDLVRESWQLVLKGLQIAPQ